MPNRPGNQGKMNTKCMQLFDVTDMMEHGCSYSDCRRCGHNILVAYKRIADIEAHGLTKCEDGLYRYIIYNGRRNNGGKKS